MMEKMLAKLVEKKKKKLAPHEMHAKMMALDGLKGEAEKVMQDDVKGLPKLKKVSVMAPNDEDLEEGLDTAKELLSGGEDEPEDMHAALAKHLGHKMEGEHEGMEDMSEEPTLEAVEAKIAKLMELKKHLMHNEE